MFVIFIMSVISICSQDLPSKGNLLWEVYLVIIFSGLMFLERKCNFTLLILNPLSIDSEKLPLSHHEFHQLCRHEEASGLQDLPGLQSRFAHKWGCKFLKVTKCSPGPFSAWIDMNWELEKKYISLNLRITLPALWLSQWITKEK